MFNTVLFIMLLGHRKNPVSEPRGLTYYVSIKQGHLVEVEEGEDADLVSLCGRSVSAGGWSCRKGSVIGLQLSLLHGPFLPRDLAAPGAGGELMPTCGQRSVSGHGAECAGPVRPGSGARAEVAAAHGARPGPRTHRALQSWELESKATDI